MTNAEKLAKDVDFLVSIISFSSFCNNFGTDFTLCTGCPLCGKECTREALKDWLKSEVEEDAEIH